MFMEGNANVTDDRDQLWLDEYEFYNMTEDAF